MSHEIKRRWKAASLHKFIAKCDLVFVSIHKNAYSKRFYFNPNVGGVGEEGGNVTPTVGFPLITQKRYKLQPWHFAAFSKRDVHAKFGIIYSPQSPDIGQNSDGGISDFWISGQSLIKRNWHNSRTSDDIDMKLGQVTKLDKRNKTRLKKFDDDVMSGNCDVIAIFSIYG